MNPTTNTENLLASLKSLAGATFENEATAYNLIQKAFEKKVIPKEHKSWVILRVSKYHEDDSKIGFRPYPMTGNPNEMFKSWSGLFWVTKSNDVKFEKLDDRCYILEIPIEVVKNKKIELEKCSIVSESNTMP